MTWCSPGLDRVPGGERQKDDGGNPSPVGERLASPLPRRRKRWAVALFLPGLVLFAIGTYLIWFDLGPLAIVLSLLGIVVSFSGFATGTIYILLPLAEPGFFTLGETGVLVESGPATTFNRAFTWNPTGNWAGWGTAKSTIPWTGVLHVRRRGRGDGARYWLLLVDWYRPIGPGLPPARAPGSHKPWIQQLSRIEISARDWDAVKSKVPAAVLPP